ncbi:hypothetical protein [uncultured Martelella sp.]|uniref:hypothetical protein n=1 Tax=uncultured Martelella sp. TaxID=392331 RepID=UPI0029C8A187|nr:hypothetical protein [uncultured Martelella sp.]
MPIPRGPSPGCGIACARLASVGELGAYRNLAFNPYDFAANEVLWPHVSANVETRSEAAFAARNAIGGCTANSKHGFWPYTSWGINREPRAELVVDFGCTVTIDRALIYLRADFPHDSWWKSATLDFSDGSECRVALTKSGHGQEVLFPEKDVSWARLHAMQKAEEPSPFPGLTQIEIWGRDGSA